MTAAITGQQAPGTDANDDSNNSDNGAVRQLTTLKGWRAFVAERPAVPELLSEDAWQALSSDDRFRYDEARLAHHAKLLVVATPTIQQVIIEGRRLQYLNRHSDAGRCGLILSGPARTGKTTCLTQLGPAATQVGALATRCPTTGSRRCGVSPPETPRVLIG